MLKIIVIFLKSFPSAVAFLWRAFDMKVHRERYTAQERYAFVRKYIYILQKKGRIRTEVFGAGNLPASGAYIMYSNHQGKYDAPGIVGAHERPCSVMAEKRRSWLIFAYQFIDLLEGVRLDRTSMRTQAQGIRQVIEKVRGGKPFIIFPEGGYKKNRNEVRQFMPGAFKCAMKAKCPIVPVVLVDSYKAFEFRLFGTVRTQVHFLPPIQYEEYRDMRSCEIADLVRSQIMEKIDSVVSAQ